MCGDGFEHTNPLCHVSKTDLVTVHVSSPAGFTRLSVNVYHAPELQGACACTATLVCALLWSC